MQLESELDRENTEKVQFHVTCVWLGFGAHKMWWLVVIEDHFYHRELPEISYAIRPRTVRRRR